FGVEMADAIAEPLLKGLAKRIAGAKLQSLIANTAGGIAVGAGGGAGGSYVAGEVASTAAAAGGGGAAGAGGARGLANPALWSNPWTIGIGAGILFGTLAWKKGWFGLNKGGRANDARDKDLAQFAGFDPPGLNDPNNPPGFHGLAAVLAKYQRSSLFQPFITA